MKTSSRGFLFPFTLTVWLAVPAMLIMPQSAQAQPRDVVSGNLVQFDDNGIWTWYSDERAVVDTNGDKLVVGCVENAAGVGGVARDGNINVSIFDVQTLTGPRWTLRTNLTSFGGGDDHNAPGLLVMANGHYLALYTGHNADSNTWYRVYDPDTVTWGPQGLFDWGTQPGGTDFKTTYSNPYNMTAEGRTYNFARSNGGGSPNCIISTNYGTNWSYGGELTWGNIPGYVQGYFKYWGNGVDRIDFICTEEHPRNYSTSIYHGYISNAMSFKTDGTIRDTNILDKLTMPTPNSFTPVFTNGTVMPPGQTNYRCWNDDVCRYPDGTIECIISARINNDYSGGDDTSTNCNHAFFFCRYDPTSGKWTPTYLCKAGYKLYSSELDYVGLGCVSPNDPNTIYISTIFDPRTDTTNSAIHEIWKGVTTNKGTNFTWTPITQNSVRDNLRPIVPAWDATDTILLWFRGNYYAAQSVDAAVVGIVEKRSEVTGQKTYMDATNANTTFVDGSPLVTGSGSNYWHLLSGGNGGTIFSSADTVGGNATGLVTQVTVPVPGTYDVWVNFWGNPVTNADWRIMAGLSTNYMQVYRQMGCRPVDAGDYAGGTSLVLTNNNTNFLYQAYVGRAVASSSNTLNVFVNDNAIQTGTTNTLVGNICRTWYDGISYAKVNPFQIQKVYSSGPSAVTLVWNSPPPEMSLTTPSYTVQKTTSLNPPISWTTVATGIQATSKAYTTTNVDNSASGSMAFYRVTWP